MALCLRSADRDSGKPADYQISLVDPLEGTYELVGASMRQSAYTISNRNDQFAFQLGAVQYVCTVATGFYASYGTLANALVAAMNTAVGGPPSFSAVYDSLTGRIVITNLTALVFQIQMGTPPDRACLNMGFRSDQTGSPLSGNEPPFFEIPEYFVSINSHGSLLNAKTQRTFAFRISATDQTYTLVHWDLEHDRNIPRQTVTFPNPTRQLHIQVTNGDGAVIPLQSDWTLYLRKACGY